MFPLHPVTLMIIGGLIALVIIVFFTTRGVKK